MNSKNTWYAILAVVVVLGILWILAQVSWLIVKLLVLAGAIYGVVYLVKRYLR